MLFYHAIKRVVVHEWDQKRSYFAATTQKCASEHHLDSFHLQAFIHSKEYGSSVQAQFKLGKGGTADGSTELRATAVGSEPIVINLERRVGDSWQPFATPEEEQAEKAQVMMRLAVGLETTSFSY